MLEAGETVGQEIAMEQSSELFSGASLQAREPAQTESGTDHYLRPSRKVIDSPTFLNLNRASAEGVG